MQPPGSTLIPLFIFAPLIIWRLYRRVRGSFERQTLSKVRPWVTVIVFPLLIALFGFAASTHPERLWLLGGAVCVGVLLGVFGLSKTRFENAPQGMFYTPNAHIGVVLSLLLAARIVYRLVQLYSSEPGTQEINGDFARSPLTLAVFGLLSGYYVAYAVGLIRWRDRQAIAP